MEDKLKQQEMQHQDDLSDIVLEKDKGSSVDRTKKILLYAASLILLFLVALVAMKLINETPSGSDNNLAQIGDEITQPAVVDESVDKISQKLEDTNKLFQQEPIIDESVETDLKFEEMVRKLKAQDAGEEEATVNETITKQAKSAADTVKKSAGTVVEKAAEKRDAFTKKADEIADSIRKSKYAEPIVKKEEPKSVKKLTPKVVAPKVVAPKVTKPVKSTKPAPKEIIAESKIVPSGSETKLSSLSGYFIQVGATANTFPDRRYLQKIKNAGYDYIVHSMVIKGKKIKKILIGPYSSKSAARADLPSVKAKINSGAYIYRIK
jgi:DedD protein